jgi:hypothetical protein
MWTILLDIPQLRAKRQCLFGLQPDQALVSRLLSLVHVITDFTLSNTGPITQFTAVHKLFLWQTLQYLEILYNKSATFYTTCLKHTTHKYSLFSATNHATSEHHIPHHVKFQVLTAVQKKIRTLPVHNTVSTGTRQPMPWADCCLYHQQHLYTSSWMNRMGIWYTGSSYGLWANGKVAMHSRHGCMWNMQYC